PWRTSSARTGSRRRGRERGSDRGPAATWRLLGARRRTALAGLYEARGVASKDAPAPRLKRKPNCSLAALCLGVTYCKGQCLTVAITVRTRRFIAQFGIRGRQHPPVLPLSAASR